MSLDAILLLVLLVATLLAFFFEVLAVEVTALALLSAILLSGLVTLEEALAGFSNKGVLAIAGLFILSHALVKTHLLEVVADRLGRRFGARPRTGVAVLLLLVALMSGFLNNTAVVAMAIPLAFDVCRRLQISPGKVLMPLSFAAIFGGTLTLIGTSTNLLVSTEAVKHGEAELGMFEFFPLGLVFLMVGLGYVVLLAPRMLTDRSASESLTRKYELAAFLTELRVQEDSKAIGRTVRELDISQRYDVTVLGLIRGSERFNEDLRVIRLRAGDVLIARGAMPGMLRLRDDLGVALLTDVKLSDSELADEEQVVVEALISPASSLIGRTLREVDFRRHYGGFVLAIRRAQATLRERLAHTPLRFSDTLLVMTSRARLEELRAHDDLVVTTELDVQLRRQRFWWLPLALIPLIMVVAAIGVVDIVVGILVSLVILMGSGAIKPRESYRAIDWSVVVFIAAFIPVGVAMDRTGLSRLLAQSVLVPVGWFPEALAPFVAISAIYLVGSLATAMITNNAAAIMLTPVAISMANTLEVAPRPFVMAVCFAASASFMTPTGYQTNMMVYGPGSYRYLDFTRFGAPLNLLFWVLATFLIPWFWPF
jgi:di/tricarboxylate transporter